MHLLFDEPMNVPNWNQVAFTAVHQTSVNTTEVVY